MPHAERRSGQGLIVRYIVFRLLSTEPLFRMNDCLNIRESEAAGLLFFIVGVDEALLDNRSREGLLAYLYLHTVAKLEGAVDEGDGTTLIFGDETVTCGNLTDLLAVAKDLIAMTRYGMGIELYAAQTLLHSFGLLAEEGLTAYELGFVEGYEMTQASHHR